MTAGPRARLAAIFHYLWSGWGAIASLLALFALWDAGNRVYGDLILPSPLASIRALGVLWQDAVLGEALLTTARRALSGFGLAIVIGSAAGIVAGLSVTAAVLTRPLVTVLMGTPPIAWVVLALIWFGATDASPIFVVLIATGPLVFIGALQGARTLDGGLAEMARAYRLPAARRFVTVSLPHILSYLFPAWISALGIAWKVVVMAELLTTPDGVGAGLAVARTQLDMASAMAWVISVVALLLMTEYLLLEPVKRRLETWREGSGGA
ncbi:MAG: ABC transporter permease subunit [Pseudomonadota bacterium]|nr:MAG: ABC transporter permease subunit [Pseudomonadota bacterium]